MRLSWLPESQSHGLELQGEDDCSTEMSMSMKLATVIPAAWDCLCSYLLCRDRVVGS